MILWTITFPMIVLGFVSLDIDVWLKVRDGLEKLMIIGIENVFWTKRVGSFRVVSITWMVKLICGSLVCNKFDG